MHRQRGSITLKLVNIQRESEGDIITKVVKAQKEKQGNTETKEYIQRQRGEH